MTTSQPRGGGARDLPLVTEQLVAAIDTPAAGGRRDPLADGVGALLALVAARPDVARFCFVEAPRAGADIAAAREALVAAFAGWLQHLGGHGTIRMRAAVGGLLGDAGR